MRPSARNILLVQLGDIGDVVLSTPTVRAIKEAYPEARVSVLVRKPFGSLLAADPGLFEAVEAVKARGNLLNALREHARFALRLRRARYDLVIDLRTGDRGAIVSFLTGAPVRVGLHCRKPFWRDLLFTETVRRLDVAPPPAHPGADQSLRVVRAVGINTADSMPRLYLSEDNLTRARKLLAGCGLPPGSRLVTVNPFSRWKYKEWSDQKWGQVMDRLWEAHRIPSVVVGSSDEAQAAARIAEGREGRAFNLAGKTTLGELAALISMSALHMGVDSAASHIAAAVGTPTLTVFGPGNWRSWTVQDEMHRVVTADMPCVPCNKKGCDDSERSRCMDELRADEVFRQLEKVLKRLQVA